MICAIATDAISDQFLTSTQEIDSEADLFAVVKQFEANLPINANTIIEACRQYDDLDHIRRELNIGLPEMNVALLALGPPYQTLNFAEEHKLRFQAYVLEKKIAILDSLRATNIATFDDGLSLDSYVKARTLNELAADPGWAEVYDELPEEVMASHLNAWLAAHNAQPFQEAIPIGGVSWSDCRNANRDQLRKLAHKGWPVLSAWCHQNGKELPKVWRIRSESQQALGTIAHERGWLEFRVLDRKTLIQRLNADGLWPAGMPTTLDLQTLGLETTAVDTAVENARRQKQEEARLSNIITIGDHELSLDQPNLPDMLGVVLSEYANNSDLWSTQARVARLDLFETTGKGVNQNRRGSSSKSRPPRDLPAGQKKAIGLLGEQLAFEWLKITHSGFITEECWVSTNRELLLQIGGGNDQLGYDFVVHLPNHTMYYEVKATTGDDLFFRLGPTEVEAAIKYRSDAKNKYRILFIQNITEPKRTKIIFLPNPYSTDYRDRFRLVTKGEAGFKFSLHR